jgi:hypothetical protein
MYGNCATDYCYDGDSAEWIQSDEPDWSNEYTWEYDIEDMGPEGDIEPPKEDPAT